MRTLPRAVLVTLILGVGPAAVRAQVPAPAQPTGAINADEAAIRASIATFVQAFQARDPAALAALFTEDAQILSDEAEPITGRAAIQAQFEADFRTYPENVKPTLAVNTESIKFLSADVALEQGTSTLTAAGTGAPPETSRYAVIFVKRNDRWFQAVVRDTKLTPASPAESLQPLEWLVGEWVDESDQATVAMNCHWTDNKAYLLREFTVQVRGEPVLVGSQRIGWDPLTRRIKSWTFDSEGGQSEGYWARNGEQWVIKMTGVLASGETTSATHIVTPVNPGSMTWASVDRTVGDRTVADLPPITIVRKPPAPTR